LRHLLFYVGVISVLGISIGVAHSIFGWSSGLTFAVAVLAGTISCTLALRDDLFAPASSTRHRSKRRA
jgi:hypothetical protein